MVSVFGVLNINVNHRTTCPFAFQDLLRNWIFNQSLNSTTKRSSTKGQICSLFSYQFACLIGQVDSHVLLYEALAELIDHQINDLNNLILGERLEYDNLINTIQEFRPKELFDFTHYARLDFLIVQTALVS